VIVRRLVIACVVLVGISAAGTASANRVVWSAPGVIVAAAAEAFDYAVGMCARGEAIAAWKDFAGVHVSVAAPRAGFAASQRLARLASPIPGRMLAVDARGDAIVAWTIANATRRSGLYAAYRPAGGSFGAAQRIAGNGVGADFDMDARGTATFAWLRTPRGRGPATLEVITRAPNGRLGDAQALQTALGVGLPSVAVNGRGDAIVTWVSGSFPGDRVWYAARRHGDRFGPAMALTPATGAANPRVGLDAHGRGLIAWAGPFTGASEGFPYAAVNTAMVRVGSATPSAARALSDPSDGGLGDFGPTVRMSQSGSALVVWEQIGSSPTAQTRIEVARSTASQPPRVSATFLTDEPEQDISSAIGPNGQAVVAWTNLSRPDQAATSPDHTAPFTAPATISAHGRNAGAPDVAVDGHGDAIAAWLDLGPSHPKTRSAPRTPLLFATTTLR
jgi:hypothetical protein